MSAIHVFKPGAPRGCGERVEGGVYAECSLSTRGMPVEFFIVDPPQVVDGGALGLTAKGVRLVQVNGVWHVFDIVGQQHYPNAADFVEEVARMGASRRLPRTLDFSLLTPESRLVLLHPRAHITNAADYFAAMGAWKPVGWECVKHVPEHRRDDAPPRMCASLWWLDVEHGHPAVLDPDTPHATRALSASPAQQSALTPVIRKMPSFSYRAWARPQGIAPAYETGIFMILPIHRLAVIRARDGSHEDGLRAARQSKLPVEVCEK